MAKLKTGRHTSGLKEMRKNTKKREINSAKKSFLKTIAKKVVTAVQNNDKAQATESLNVAFSALDKAVKTSTIHANKAARQKSLLSKKLQKIG